MLKVNEQKQKRIEVEGRSYDRFAIPTPVLSLIHIFPFQRAD